MLRVRQIDIMRSREEKRMSGFSFSAFRETLSKKFGLFEPFSNTFTWQNGKNSKIALLEVRFS